MGHYYFQIDSSVIPLMSDEDLKKYISAYGDRLAIVGFCRRQMDNEGDGTATDRVVERLRNKIRARKKKHPDTASSHPRSTNLKKKPTRKIELGWKNYSYDEGCYIQVRKIDGGSTRSPDVKRIDGKIELVALGKALFFRNGHSKKGRIEDFTYDIQDFEGRDIGDLTVDDLYEQTQVQRLRLYLCTKKMPNEDVSVFRECQGQWN